MNTRSLSLYQTFPLIIKNIKKMKSILLIKVLIVLPIIMFVDYIMMAILGCTSCLLGMGENFYCGQYCLIGKIVLVLSGILFLYIIYPEIKAIYKSQKNGSTTEK